MVETVTYDYMTVKDRRLIFTHYLLLCTYDSSSCKRDLILNYKHMYYIAIVENNVKIKTDIIYRSNVNLVYAKQNI